MSLQRVLVVEDDPLVRQVLVAMLERHGWQAVSATSADQALAHDLDEIDLAIIDVGLPQTAGTELGKTLASRAPHIGRLLISGYPDSAFDLTPVEREHFLSKPFSHGDLERALIHLAGASHAGSTRATRADASAAA